MPPKDHSLSLEADPEPRSPRPLSNNISATGTGTPAVSARMVERDDALLEQSLDVAVQTQTQTQSQLWTQTQECDEESLSQLSPVPPLSPPPLAPWGRCLPCSELNKVFDLLPRAPAKPQPNQPKQAPIHVPGIPAPVHASDIFNEHWFGRSNACDITATVRLPSNSQARDNQRQEREANLYLWAHSMISNRHCRIYCVAGTATPNENSFQVYVENHSGNGTLINQTILLKKGEKRILHSGDEITLVNQNALRKKIRSSRFLQPLLQNYSYVFVNLLNRQPHLQPAYAQKKRRACVNPRAMNYKNRPSYGINHPLRPQQSPQAIQNTNTSAFRRIEAEYDIRDVLGDGTSGQVRRAIHRKTGVQCAVKVVPLRRNRQILDSTQMEQEASILRSMDHPYIVNLIDVYINPGVAMYLVMELVRGGDLFDRIVEKEQYTQTESRRVMRRLLSAVYYLHEKRNIVHRDLKPENILCVHADNPIEVKLTDFGLAKIVKEEDGLKTFCGTPQYFAPEVLQRKNTVAGHGRYGKPADMWSLGVILYILLTGRPPFSPLEEKLSVTYSDKLWKDMPEAKDLVQKLLREDPKRRLSVRQACDHAWILMDDGDTHVHPFDDPILTNCKCLFPSKSNAQRHLRTSVSKPYGDFKPVPSSSSSSSELGEDASSTTSSCGKAEVDSNHSILSKEDFAKSAVPEEYNQPSGSLFALAIGDRSNSMVRSDSYVEQTTDHVDTKDSSQIAKTSTTSDSAVGSSSVKGVSTPEACEGAETQQPETVKAKNGSKSSHTPSNAVPRSNSPESPLAVVSFKTRSNLFRKRVLDKLDENLKSENGSPRTKNQKVLASIVGKTDEPQKEDAVMTGTPSNVIAPTLDQKRVRTENEPTELPDDEVQSQFSIATESISSFGSLLAPPNCSKLDVTNSQSRKRKVPNNTLEEQPLCSEKKSITKKPKIAGTGGGKQTTLLNWFVKPTVHDESVTPMSTKLN